ncbi:VIT1/CCC1 transporter family protein [Nocardioides jishulii]|uniref:VIT family protein n=1 Tax=Nocardioides jishulii TaxID=2575440 RepID=A0A4U2YSS7_9ACTN|nr:VIT family protein [Nocardioides jishulii]QCX28893.1 VIT family protein [Nocardioides jishulii]TKI64210.1 VIT family protein [Nocardioides jishulii]
MTFEIGTDENPQHWHADLAGGVSGRLNWLRAAVLGSNDGIISTAGVVMGVAGATSDESSILLAGVAALTAGAISMAAGEYVSVSTQRDSERSILAMEKLELERMPETEREELVEMLRDKGLTEATAEQVATELHEHDALAAHAEVEFGINPNDLTNPWHAAWASMISFTLGALIPLVLLALLPESVRLPLTVVVVAAALAVTGAVSAHLGYSPKGRAVLRNVVGGLLAMGITYLVGMLFGVTVG